MSKDTKSVEEMTAEELQELLDQKKKQERQAKEKREREYESRKDKFVMETARSFKQLHNRLKDFKEEVISTGNELHSEMYKVFQKEERDLKKFSLVTNDGLYKLTLERSDRQAFTEKAEVAINQIKDILRDKFSGRSKTMYNIINDILIKNNKGDYDERLVAKLRKQESKINDPKFSEALDILSDSYQVESTALYVRAYHRENPDKGWKDITLQFSSL